MRYVVFFFIFFARGHLPAATIVITTDQDSGQRANEVRRYLLRTPPFSQMENLEVKVVKVNNSRDLSCAGGAHGIDRLVTCRSSELASLALQHGADRLVHITSNIKYGGSGGQFAVANSGLPNAMVMHELLHTLGLCDEYKYSAADAQIYCPHIKTAANVAVFKSVPPYASDEVAKRQHGSDIPWFGQIERTTPIVTGTQLGTPNPDKIGVFAAGVCSEAKPPVETWKPGSKSTVMGDFTDHVPRGVWNSVAQRLGTRIRGEILPGGRTISPQNPGVKVGQ